MFHNSNSILILWFICRFHSNSAIWKKRVTDRRTDRLMDGRTDRPSYRDACTHLKKQTNSFHCVIQKITLTVLTLDLRLQSKKMLTKISNIWVYKYSYKVFPPPLGLSGRDPKNVSMKLWFRKIISKLVKSLAMIQFNWEAKFSH